MGGIELKHYFKVGLGAGYSYYKQEDNGFTYSSYGGNYTYDLTPESVITHRIPLYLYLRSDFLDKKISPFIDFKIGNNFLITKEIVNVVTYYHSNQTPMMKGIYGDEPKGENVGDFRLKNGLFVATNVGVAFKVNHRNAINISAGYQSVSRNHDMFWSYAYDLKKHVKTGYTIIDHQFLFNLGISF